ncbi:MAG: hypothetical protein K0U37_05720 [Gammaproteobacteria bacterium]|nr:hypothetical protein [Gammaproteobacteria bacterium]
MKTKYAVLAFALCAAPQSHATPYFPAQILGRDLSIKGLGWAGHVGLTIAKHFSDTAENVIEVLNEIDVIQINTIEHFKQNTRFWGSRYGIADQSPAANHIISEALRQRALCPIYTDSATYYAGEGTPENPTRCAVFRCDTFINYLFHYAGYTLPTYHGKTLPRLVFKAFPKTHGDGNITPDLTLDNFKKTFDLPKAETTTQTIQNTWRLAQNPNLTHEKRLFLLDYLGLNGSPELITAFINYYKNQTNQNIKSMLIRSTFTLYQTHFIGKPHPELQRFYQHLLTTPLQSKDIPFVIRGFISLSNTRERLDYQSQINALLHQHATNLSPATKMSLHNLLVQS